VRVPLCWACSSSPSLSPEEKITANAFVETRINAYSALISLANAFIISLVALIPGYFGIFVIIFSVLSFSITLQNGIEVLRPHEGAGSLARRLILTLLNLFLYIAECCCGVRIIINSHDSTPFNVLAILVVAVYLLSIFRTCELLGGARRRPHLHTAIHTQQTLSTSADENATTANE
jgi:hypothetical protein